jgi:M6 family metalloprotease-like protein
MRKRSCALGAAGTPPRAACSRTPPSEVDHPRQLQDIAKRTVTRADVTTAPRTRLYRASGNICSAREYFQKVSSGRLDYTNVVVGPYTLSRNRQFYVNTLLIEEALNLAVADGLDLTQFDSRHENVIDALNVLYAGQTQYNGELWPHNFHIDLQFGNIKTDLYLLTSLGRSAADLSIGTFCHENGHLLCRFPDMYDYGQRDGDRFPARASGCIASWAPAITWIPAAARRRY